MSKTDLILAIPFVSKLLNCCPEGIFKTWYWYISVYLITLVGEDKYACSNGGLNV